MLSNQNPIRSYCSWFMLFTAATFLQLGVFSTAVQFVDTENGYIYKHKLVKCRSCSEADQLAKLGLLNTNLSSGREEDLHLIL